jgi:hypothetical protein
MLNVSPVSSIAWLISTCQSARQWRPPTARIVSVTARACGPNPARTAFAPVPARGRAGCSLPSATARCPARVRFQVSSLPCLPFVSARPCRSSVRAARRTYDRPSASSAVTMRAIWRAVAIGPLRCARRPASAECLS